MKRCAGCADEKPLDEFGPHRRYRDGKRTYCRPCHNARNLRDYHASPERAQDRWLRRMYKLSLEEYRTMAQAQGYVCAICLQPEREVDYRTGNVKALAVDHDHTTGQVRGLLCFLCNTAIGKLGHSAVRLRRAAAYMEALEGGVNESLIANLSVATTVQVGVTFEEF